MVLISYYDEANPENIMPIKLLYEKYERYFSPAALIGGFILDNLTLRRIDLWAENLIILIYLFIVGLSIALVNAFEAGRFKSRLITKVTGFMPFLMQFAFGGLFSVFVVFYRRSSEWTASWPFLLFLIVLLFGNELLRRRYERFTFQLSVYFIVIFSYAAFSVPVLVGKIGPDIFLLSGLASLCLFGLILFMLYYVAPERFKESRRPLIISVGVIYFAFHVLYFANIIPPIPLALKESGIYHMVERTAAGYFVTYEPAPAYRFWAEEDSAYHWRPGEPVYCFSAVFAPTKISTTIFHRWSFYDERTGEWVEEGRLSFPIKGGRDGGYRGYSIKYQVKAGEWRVDVMTESGQILGRIPFTIVADMDSVLLKNKII